eukprot:3328069-Pleurochrysis_carterae.AAC.1
MTRSMLRCMQPFRSSQMTSACIQQGRCNANLEFVRNVELVRIEKEQDHVGARCEPAHARSHTSD